MSGKRQIVTQFPGSTAITPDSLGGGNADALTAKLQNQVDNIEIDNDSVDSIQVNDENRASIIADIIKALKNVYDPEIPVNIYDLGLIYNVDLDNDGTAFIEMTLTTPGCPIAQTFPYMVEQVAIKVNGVNDAEVNLVWDPPWTKENMSPEALLSLGLL